MDLSALGKQPIGTDYPAGSDVRYDPAFDELQSEVDKLSSPAAAGSVDWEKVTRLAADILTNKSKDMLVASYLAVALIHTRRDDGFSVGLSLYSDLIEQFWEELYPQKIRMRGRVRALEWWLEKSEVALQQITELSFSLDQIARVDEDLNRLDHFLQAHLKNDSPSLSPIQKYFNALQTATSYECEVATRVSPETLEEEPSVAQPKRQESQDAAVLQQVNLLQEPAGLQGTTSRQEAAKVLNDGLLQINQASFHLWQQDLASPHAYRLTRKTSWYALDEQPPATNGQTRIPPPPSHVKNLLLNLRNNGDAAALLQAAETRQPQYIFWLDLNFIVAEALTRLGTGFERANQAVCQETAFLLHRLPGLQELSFSDATPFAAPDTRQWLKMIALRQTSIDISRLTAVDPNVATGTVSITDSGSVSGTEAVIGKTMGDLQQMVCTGNLIEAMEVVQQKLGSCSSRRENLLWRLSLSQMLVELGKSKLALPHLEQVLDDIAGHGLEQYEPSLALRGYKLAWLAFDSQTEQKFKDQAQDVLHQIGRLDMPEMVRLTTT
jgi:type VI secretion system protein VasJ